ncbi:MAG TPA: M36 family metallopeptidase [Pyrinomonadaceae bacterium]|nr:M36 family metallopeptidase [Pyrinomonadaceae bacterium]
MRATLFTLLIATVLGSGLFVSSAQLGGAGGVSLPGGGGAEANMPSGVDVRGQFGVPHGLGSRTLTAAQQKALKALEAEAGAPLAVQYNGLTATPRHLYTHGGYLSAPSAAAPEQVAREFLGRYRELFRFSQEDLDGLRLKSRTTLPDLGTTVLLFEQTAGGLSVYKGEVLVNVSRAGRVISVGGDSFPRLSVTNSFALTPAQAVGRAAAAMNISGFTPQPKGTKQVLRTYGDLPHEYETGERFARGVFSDEIVVTRTVFPTGDAGRAAYKFVLTTPQYRGIMWQNIVDAQTGEVLLRMSLTSFYGEPGGGPQNSRRASFRPDIQNLVESFNSAGTAAGKVFDGMPTMMSGYGGFGRPAARGVRPTYAPETTINRGASTGRGFRESLIRAKNQGPYAEPGTPLFSSVYGAPFGQVTRGFPDASNPTPGSPFGWFYLPTGDGGAEISATAANSSRAATRAYGYSMSEEARARNLAANSPAGDKSQPFAADLTPLASARKLADGRTLSSVFQSRYTEGNNAVVADDRFNDDEVTHGVKGYSADRKFTAVYFDYINGYEFDGGDATGSDPVNFPASANPDVYPGTATLFYYNNLLHDYLYQIGFTETTWNFQQDNFGRGGAAGDGVSAQVQDGSGLNNANFGTPDDGQMPRMQMYLFTDGIFRRADGSFDFEIVAHELHHGVSNRSVGKGQAGCLGALFTPAVSFGEAGGMGEGWSDYIASSMSDDDSAADYSTGNYDSAIRRLPYTNYRWSYGAVRAGVLMNRRDFPAPPDPRDPIPVPYEVHNVGEIWAATLWDMRELFIMKQPAGQFFDGDRRLGQGATFYIGNRQVKSVDAKHPIDYRESFGSSTLATSGDIVTEVGAQIPTIVAAQHIVRPGRVNAENQAYPGRNGPLATAVSKGARLADTIMLRGMQLAPCQPSFVDMRDAMLLADTELTGGENRALIWRAFASHGVGLLAFSSTSVHAVEGNPTENNPVIVEDFTVPAGVTTCEQEGPLAPPDFSLSSPSEGTVTVTITPSAGAASYVISRADAADGPFVKIAEIPASQNTYTDDNNGQKLPASPSGRTYFYQVRAARNADCVGSSQTKSVVVFGQPEVPSPLFAGLAQVADPKEGSSLILSWGPALSPDPLAQIVYDVHRVSHVDHGNDVGFPVNPPPHDPTFVPDAANRVATVTGTSYTDKGLEMGQPYYYIVRARDARNNRLDTNGLGNTVTKFNAPTIRRLAAPSFALETFESEAANARFAPPLTESGNDPDQNSQTFQRVEGANQSGIGLTDGKMYAPDFSPDDEEGLGDPAELHGGGPSDFAAVIGPFNTDASNMLTPTSIMEFDNFINAENAFDGGVIEIAVGGPNFNATPYPDNTTTFDAGNYIIEGGYNGKLDGPPVAGPGSGTALQGRRAYTGVKAPHHVRVALRSFAPGGVHNPQGLPVFIRFRMTSDVASANGLDSGWYVDNLVVNNLSCRVNVSSAEAGATAAASSVYPNWDFGAASAIDGDRTGKDWGAGGGWNDGTRATYPDWLEVTFASASTIDEVRVYTLQDNYAGGAEPTETTTANENGIIDFDVQTWDGTSWVTVPGGAIRGNSLALRSVTFPAVTTTKLRVLVLNSRLNYSRVVEVEAFGCGQ